MINQNVKQLFRNVAQRRDGLWGVNVWSGDGTSVCRKYYKTRKEARDGDISHGTEHGVIDGGPYID